MSRAVPLATIGQVDQAVAAIIGTEAPSRVLALAQAKVIAADPATHAAKVEAERRRRYVKLSQTDEHGLRFLIARITAGDAVWVDATIEYVADLIAKDHPEASREELRAIAFGWLARPVELAALLTGTPDEHTEQTEQTEKAVHADRRRRHAVLHVHLHEAALDGIGDPVVRVEGIGPFALDRLRELIGHAHLTIKPVRDLKDRVRLSCYEHPTDLKERVHLITDGDRFPYSGSQGRGADYDHPTPYRHDGPPGQTGTHNSTPLGRRHHRWKTHAGYTSRQCGDGRYIWRTPHGRYYLLDHQGTRPLPPTHGQLIHDAPPGVDIYVPDIRLDLAGQ
jgi:antitoxin (DNA-binding transcriptional repressor) of toxin-antitoxin stability system